MVEWLLSERPAGRRWTPLWFGRCKDTPIRDVPDDYLRWLVANCDDTTSQPIRGLLLWIREHIPS